MTKAEMIAAGKARKAETREQKLRVHYAKTSNNIGRHVFKTYCDIRGLPPIERKQQYTFTDLITDVLTFAKNKGNDVDRIIDSVQEHLEAETLENCPKCGAQVTRDCAFQDEGEGEEYGRTFYYCSEHCRETH